MSFPYPYQYQSGYFPVPPRLTTLPPCQSCEKNVDNYEILKRKYKHLEDLEIKESMALRKAEGEIKKLKKDLEEKEKGYQKKNSELIKERMRNARNDQDITREIDTANYWKRKYQNLNFDFWRLQKIEKLKNFSSYYSYRSEGSLDIFFKVSKIERTSEVFFIRCYNRIEENPSEMCNFFIASENTICQILRSKTGDDEDFKAFFRKIASSVRKCHLVILTNGIPESFLYEEGDDEFFGRVIGINTFAGELEEGEIPEPKRIRFSK